MSNLFSTGGAGNVGASEGIDQQSLKFNDDESQYLSWTPASAGNRKTWTWSGWVKRGNLSTSQHLFGALGSKTDTTYARLWIGTTDILRFSYYNNFWLETTAVFRDPSAWYHIVLTFDTTQVTETDRIKLYVNGVRITDFVTENYPAQNTDQGINNNSEHNIAAFEAGTSTKITFFDGYLSDIHFIDGQALDPTSFGQFTNGYWEAIDYAGTYGTNGFHLTFQDDVVSEGFNAVTYTGNGSTQSISGLGFEPDFVWVKDRSTGSSNRLHDTIRGAGIKLSSDTTAAEADESSSFTSFDADGFSLAGSAGAYNTSGRSYVAWAWDAGSGSPVSNTDGSITSTVKANPSYGFSIGTFTKGSGTETFGHGLTSAPELLILKRRDSTGSWFSYSSVTGADKWIRLNGSDAATTDSTFWNNTAPTSSVATISTAYNSGEQLVFYAFNSVAGYSSIGSYTGNGSTSGPTITTGFRPALVMVKNTGDATFGNWHVFDNTRNVPDFQENRLEWNTSDEEAVASGYFLGNFTDTGFEITNSSSHINHLDKTFIYMAFADTREAAFWKDVSGQGNHWTPNNLDYRDSLIDSPANNFAVLNPLVSLDYGSSGNGTLSEGNLKCVWSGSLVFGTRLGTIGVSSGKWYYEADWEDNSSSTAGYGFLDSNGSVDDGRLIISTSGTYMCAVDMDNLLIWFGVDGVWTGDPDAGTGGTSIPDVGYRFPSFRENSTTSGNDWTVIANFGQDSTFAGARPAGGNTDDNGIGDFAYAPPSGYLALCTANLPTPTIIDGSDHFNTVLFTGDNADRNIDVGFKSDFVWLKHRNDASAHRLYDSLRGDGKALFSNLTNAEYNGVDDGVEFAYADGFNIDVGANVYSYNDSSQTYATWNWKAGGTAVSNTAGSITSQVSANVDAGFSIVSYTGTGSVATIGHGLNSPLDMFIIKNRDRVENWPVYARPAGNGGLFLDGTNSYSSSSSFTNNTDPAGGVFTIGTNTALNVNGEDCIAYCFHSVAGYSKVGSYTGNGSSDGPFVYTGFRPAWVMVKRTDNTADWQIYDTKRGVTNVITTTLAANVSSAESAFSSGYNIDFISNGFKPRSGPSNVINTSGATYIYLAFAENPFKYANAR